MWLSVWTRAVIAPASRRAQGVWAGALVVGAVVFGGTGMAPADLTGIALGIPGVGAVLALTWLLVFVPVARGLVRGDGGRYLWSLPAPPIWPTALTVGALIALQLPWLALWVLGEGLLGLGVVAALTLPIALVAAWRPRPGRRIGARWRGGAAALRGVYARALRRRAADALLRGAGVSILAGMLAGLLVRNNGLTGAAAGTLGAAAIAIVLVAAQVGVRLVLLDAHRQSAWLAASTGVSERARVVSLGVTIAGVDAAATAIAVIAAAITGGLDLAGAAWLALIALGAVVASATGGTAGLVRAEASPSVATRVIVGALVTAGVVVLWLGLVGPAGIAGAIASVGLLAMRRRAA